MTTCKLIKYHKPMVQEEAGGLQIQVGSRSASSNPLVQIVLHIFQNSKAGRNLEICFYSWLFPAACENLSFPTGDQTNTPCTGSTES